MHIRRLAAVVGTAAVVFAACSSSATPSAAGGGGGATGAGCTVGVSWNNFQQPRWAATDKPNIQKVVEDAGGKYIDKDANLSTEQQLTDVDTLISQGAKVLILLAQNTDVVGPALEKAKAVGKAEADAILAKVPKGNYVLIKGDPGDPNAKTFLPQGWDEAGLKDKVASGDIKLLNGPDGTFTDAWKTE
jgi:D-xylose transport system substrate-binding protein